MSGVEFLQTSDELLKIRRRRTPRSAITPLVMLLVWLALVALLNPLAFYGMVVLGLGAGTLPFLLPKVRRALRVAEVTLSRSGPLLLLDLEPLEAARVETRVLTTWATKTPRGYTVSLWVLFTEGGSRDIELGRFPSLLAASEAAGTVEAFLALAAIKSRPSTVP